MPSVVAPSTLLDYIDVHDLPTTPSRARQARRGFWRTLVHYATRSRARKTSRRPPRCTTSHQIDTPAELLARQYPTIYLYAFLGV
jgi:hypothetical protein